MFHALRKVFRHCATLRAPHWRGLLIYLMLCVCVCVCKHSTLAFHASNVEVRGQLVGEAGSLSAMFMLGTELRPSFGVSITSARRNLWLLACVLG